MSAELVRYIDAASMMGVSIAALYRGEFRGVKLPSVCKREGNVNYYLKDEVEVAAERCEEARKKPRKRIKPDSHAERSLLAKASPKPETFIPGDWLTADEAVELLGTDANDVRFLSTHGHICSDKMFSRMIYYRPDLFAVKKERMLLSERVETPSDTGFFDFDDFEPITAETLRNWLDNLRAEIVEIVRTEVQKALK